MVLALDSYRKAGDPPADSFVQAYFSKNELKTKFNQALSLLNKNADWPKFLKQIPEASWFDDEWVRTPPLDPKVTSSAIQFFQKRETYILQLLGLLSLPYCYAAADGAKVLYQTERMYKDLGNRLAETGAFVTAMMKPKAFDDDGDGKVQLFKVRVMHAAARFYLQKSNWNQTLGLPVNQEDMAGTHLSFSLIVVRGLRKMGFNISYQEQMNYIQYWNWIGACLGLRPELLPQDGKSAHDLEMAISKRQFKTSLEGKVLVQSLLQFFYQLNDQKDFKNEEISGFMRYLLGSRVADVLGLPPQNFPLSKQILLKLKVAVNP